MARPLGLAKQMRYALSTRHMTHSELCAAFPDYTPRQISNALNQQAWTLPGIRNYGSWKKSIYKATRQ